MDWWSLVFRARLRFGNHYQLLMVTPIPTEVVV
jgi:hypothetical protein